MKKIIIGMFALFLLSACLQSVRQRECYECGEDRYWLCTDERIPMCTNRGPVCWNGEPPYCPR